LAEATACPPSVVADTIMRTIELGVTITDAAVEENQTTIFCTPVVRDPRCPDCGRDGRYRDTVTWPLTDLPVAGYPLVLRVAVPRYRCTTPECAGGVQSGTRHARRAAVVDDAALCPVCVAAVDDRPGELRSHRASS
jgi:transposase